jgi:hypothetical protein
MQCGALGGIQEWRLQGGRRAARRWRRRMHTGVTWTVVTSLVTLAYWRPALVIPAFASPLVTLGGHWKLFHLAPANNRAALFVVSAAPRDDNNRCYRRNLSLNGPSALGWGLTHGESDSRRARYYISAQSLWFHLCGGGASRCISFPLSPCGTPRESEKYVAATLFLPPLPIAQLADTLKCDIYGCHIFVLF